MLLLEVTGSSCRALEVFRPGEGAQLVPFAVLGDFALKVRLEQGCTARRFEIQQALEALGLRVLGYRWQG